jgi:prepilin-type N-terminal cleavage/methylation domain-containing protein/prepilin-type processing-associated H-X9-DG protein
MKTHHTRSTTGFTLVELLVVIVIIATLAALSMMGYTRMRAAGDRATAMSTVRQLQMANYAYSVDNNGKYVPLKSEDNQNSANNLSWVDNALFISYLTGDRTALDQGRRKISDVPVSILDPIVLRSKGRLYKKLFASYGYVTDNMVANTVGNVTETGFKVSQVTNPSRSASFITATDHHAKYGGRFVWNASSEEGKSTDGRLAFRHGSRAIVVYYDGSTGLITQDELRRIDGQGGRNHPFWKANH